MFIELLSLSSEIATGKDFVKPEEAQSSGDQSSEEQSEGQSSEDQTFDGTEMDKAAVEQIIATEEPMGDEYLPYYIALALIALAIVGFYFHKIFFKTKAQSSGKKKN